MLFQSTPPARGATRNRKCCVRLRSISIHAPREGGDVKLCAITSHNVISIHAPREGGDSRPPAPPAATGISIHAPREGGDLAYCCTCAEDSLFQSTPPARGATTERLPELRAVLHFNPRPPRGGRQFFEICGLGGSYFNPRPPRGGRLCGTGGRAARTEISIHAPREGGDSRRHRFDAGNNISIHAPREGGDCRLSLPVCTTGDFNPRPPRGGRHEVAYCL